MKNEETILNKLENAKTYKSISNSNNLTLIDPISQLCKRFETFFKADSDITCRFAVNNHQSLGPNIDPDTGEPYTKKITIDGETIDAILEKDHICEFRIFVNDYEKAQCLSNVIRHRHVIPETFEGSDNKIHLRNHYLLVRVCVIDAIDPSSSDAGNDPWIADDDTNQGVQEIFGLEPIDWNDTEGNGCNERLAPSSTSTEEIPKGAPEEYEQKQWEAQESSCAWKWIWLKKALKGNKNIVKTYDVQGGYPFTNTWRFIECSSKPVIFQEDNLTSYRGYNAILPADLLPLIFSVFGKFQISTYVYKE